MRQTERDAKYTSSSASENRGGYSTLYTLCSFAARVILKPMQPEQIEQLKLRLAALRVEHRDLDHAISSLEAAAYIDQLQLRRLKKRKLYLKDLIERLESKLIPDLNA